MPVRRLLFGLLALFLAAPNFVFAAEPATCMAAPGRVARTVDGDVTGTNDYREGLGNGWTFALLPVRHGWDLRIFDADDVDLTRLTPPYRFGPNAREIYGWHFRNQDNTAANDGSVNAYQHVRNFVISPELAVTTVDPFAVDMTDPAILETQGQGTLTILDFRLADLEPGG